MRKPAVIGAAIAGLVIVIAAVVTVLVFTTGRPDNESACRTATEKLYVQLLAGKNPNTAEPASCKALPEKVRVQIAYDVLHKPN